jgi:hypothetical protein
MRSQLEKSSRKSYEWRSCFPLLSWLLHAWLVKRGEEKRPDTQRYPAGATAGPFFPTPPRTWLDSLVDSFDLSLLQDNEWNLWPVFMTRYLPELNPAAAERTHRRHSSIKLATNPVHPV